MSKKIVAGVLGLAMAFTLVTPVTAQTVSIADLLAQIAQLQAQLQALQGGTTVTTTFTTDLTVGSRGADVVALQNFLIGKGFLAAGLNTGYFGSLTQAAVAQYQTSKGITPTAGYFGPITRAAVNAEVGVTPGTPGTPGTPSTGLQGGEGYLDSEVLIDADIQIDLGDTETVIEVEFEAQDSDIAINRVDFMFDARPWLYFDEVNLIVDGREVASLSRSSDFSEVSGDYRARFTGLNEIIREGDTSVVGLELVVLSSMAGTRDQDPVEITLLADGVRFIDGAGLTDYAPGSDVGPVVVTFDESFGQGDINVTVGDSSPENLQIVLNETSRTNGVEILTFDVEAEDSDVEVTDVEVEIAVGTSTANALYRAYLYRGNTLLKQSSVTGTTTTFTGVDYSIDEDDVETFRIVVDFNRADTNGLTLPTTLTVVDVKVDGEDADFEAVSDTASVNEEHAVIVEGILADLVSTSVSTQEVGDSVIGKYTFVLDITAVGSNFFIDEDGEVAINATTSSADASVTGIVLSSNATAVGDSYRINKDQTREVTVEVWVEMASSTSGTVRVTLEDIAYGTSSGSPTGETLDLGAPTYRSGTAYLSN